jgi:hypothetical protein
MTLYGRLAALLTRPVVAALLLAAGLHLLWWWLIANAGGDIAAQDAWAEFARSHPGSAYNLAWYGGMHPVSYSVLSPYVMAMLGVRSTMMVAGTVSAALLALLLVRSRAVQRPLWPALYGAVALACNAVSGRVTFGLGLMFGLAAVAVIFAWPEQWRTTHARHRVPRAMLAGGLAVLATLSSPVAGVFLGVVAAALWLGGRRPAAYSIGVPPVVVVALSTWLFPFSGEQPMKWQSTVLPVVLGVCCWALAPRAWRTVRIGSLVYVVGIIAVWAVPSPIGSNLTRLGLIFGGVVLVVAMTARMPAHRRAEQPIATRRAPRASRTVRSLAVAVAIASAWQVGVAVADVVTSRPDESWTTDLDPLLAQLEALNAETSRVEVVPTSSHREASALAPYVNLARGWNRQVDAERNPIFYQPGLLTNDSYRAWLDRWAVSYVVLPTGPPDEAGLAEAELVQSDPSYLREVWSDANWRLFRVTSPTPLADFPAVVTYFDASEVEVYMPSAGTVLVRIPNSPWLSLVDDSGNPLPTATSTDGASAGTVNGCLSAQQEPPSAPGQVADTWTVLHAPRAGSYRIAAPYTVPRGTSCPDETTE